MVNAHDCVTKSFTGPTPSQVIGLLVMAFRFQALATAVANALSHPIFHVLTQGLEKCGYYLALYQIGNSRGLGCPYQLGSLSSEELAVVTGYCLPSGVPDKLSHFQFSTKFQTLHLQAAEKHITDY